ncbi:MAG: MBL fold metallo-hydrolase, partial [Bacteroidota bacterium]
MDVKIKFLGAARTVTGSKYLIEANKQKILLDCGMFQGQKELRLRNWDKLPIDPADID